MRLPPEVFWAMSLGEWRAAVSGFAHRSSRATPLAHADLDRLMQLYPDEVPQWQMRPSM
jgi:uncharacterized phage protein (TIGR02216 family)